MRRLIAVLLGAILGGATVFAAFNYHLLRTSKGWMIVPRRHADWHDAYADVRQWSHRDWGEHRDLAGDLIAIGRGDLVARSLTDQLFRGLFDSFRDTGSDGRSNPPSK